MQPIESFHVLPRRPRPQDVTAREREVLDLMAEGWSNAHICDVLCVGTKTVESHIGSVYAKLAVCDDPYVHQRVRAVSLWRGFRAAAGSESATA